MAGVIYFCSVVYCVLSLKIKMKAKPKKEIGAQQGNADPGIARTELVLAIIRDSV